jgi:hypothetical protein
MEAPTNSQLNSKGTEDLTMMRMMRDSQKENIQSVGEGDKYMSTA